MRHWKAKTHMKGIQTKVCTSYSRSSVSLFTRKYLRFQDPTGSYEFHTNSNTEKE